MLGRRWLVWCHTHLGCGDTDPIFIHTLPGGHQRISERGGGGEQQIIWKQATISGHPGLLTHAAVSSTALSSVLIHLLFAGCAVLLAAAEALIL